MKKSGGRTSSGSGRKKKQKSSSPPKTRRKSYWGRDELETGRKPRSTVIVRSSGRKEKFDTGKMAQTISRSGTPFMMARDIAKKMSRKVEALSSSPKANKAHRRVTEAEGARIRKMVAQELRQRNRPDIASSYTGEKPENTRQGRHPLMNENEPVLDNVAANRSRLLYDGTSFFAKSTKARTK